MLEQIYKMDGELSVDRNRLTLAPKKDDTSTKISDRVVAVLRSVGDSTFTVLMIVIVVAHPIWVALLTSFVYF